MKARSILIISGAVVLALIIGLVIYLAANRPGALLTNVFDGSNLNNNEPSNKENESSQVVAEGEINELGIPSVTKESTGWCLFMTEKNCNLLVIVNKLTGERYGGLAVNLAKDTTVYAPFDGYVHRMWAQDKSVVMVMITTDPEWVLGKNDGVDSPGYYSVSFAAKSVDLLVNDQVKKGDPLFKLSSDESIWDQYLEGKHNLVFYPGGPWSEIGNPSEDPKEYLIQLMKIIK